MLNYERVVERFKQHASWQTVLTDEELAQFRRLVYMPPHFFYMLIGATILLLLVVLQVTAPLRIPPKPDLQLTAAQYERERDASYEQMMTGFFCQGRIIGQLPSGEAYRTTAQYDVYYSLGLPEPSRDFKERHCARERDDTLTYVVYTPEYLIDITRYSQAQQMRVATCRDYALGVLPDERIFWIESNDHVDNSRLRMPDERTITFYCDDRQGTLFNWRMVGILLVCGAMTGLHWGWMRWQLRDHKYLTIRNEDGAAVLHYDGTDITPTTYREVDAFDSQGAGIRRMSVLQTTLVLAVIATVLAYLLSMF